MGGEKMAVQKLMFIFVGLLMIISMAAAWRIPAHRSLEHRLKLNLTARSRDGMVHCWEALLEVQDCTGEILLFFLNRESYIGPDCCQAIRVIAHQCWPNMLKSIGFTPKEGHILSNYCDKPSPSSVAAPSPSPVPSLGL